MLDLQKRMIMTGFNFTFFAKVEISTNSTFVSYSFDVPLTTFITSDVTVDNLCLLLAFALNIGLFQEGVLDFFHQFWDHFSEFLLNIGFSDLADLADFSFRLIQDWIVEFSFLDIFFCDFWLGFRN